MSIHHHKHNRTTIFDIGYCSVHTVLRSAGSLFGSCIFVLLRINWIWNKIMLDPDLDEYLTEYRLQAPTEPISHYEGELRVWMCAAKKECPTTNIMWQFHIVIIISNNRHALWRFRYVSVSVSSLGLENILNSIRAKWFMKTQLSKFRMNNTIIISSNCLQIVFMLRYIAH